MYVRFHNKGSNRLAVSDSNDQSRGCKYAYMKRHEWLEELTDVTGDCGSTRILVGLVHDSNMKADVAL